MPISTVQRAGTVKKIDLKSSVYKQCLPALALLPAVAVRRRRSPLQLAVVALVADAGALGAAAQRVRQAAGPVEVEGSFFSQVCSVFGGFGSGF